MSLYRTVYDPGTLATAMLPLLKAQSRIDRTDEDVQATEIMARAIGRVERQSGICIAPAVYTWTPRDPSYSAYTEASPPQVWASVQVPVRGFGEVTGVDVDDVPLAFTMTGDTGQVAYGRAWIQRQPSGMQVSDTWTIAAGYDNPDDMPPELRDTLVRYAAALWENREAWGNNVDVMPEWVTEALGIFWVPEV